LNIVWTVEIGLVPMWPNTTPSAPRTSALGAVAAARRVYADVGMARARARGGTVSRPRTGTADPARAYAPP
jgi:hypothetical protein